MPALSILDLAFVPEGGTPADALRRALELAQHAERWGYHALLARRASQHGRRRERRDVGRASATSPAARARSASAPAASCCRTIRRS